MLELKKELYLKCIEIIEKRISVAEQAIVSAKEASENDTKSSAGDKYETTREMMQQEISRNEKQLHEARKLRHALTLINPEKSTLEIQQGSLVFTDQGKFFIATSIGQLKVNNEVFFIISSFSPIGKQLVGMAEGEELTFNEKKFKIQKVY